MNDNNFYCGSSRNLPCQLARLDQVPEQYIHPATKVCNYIYTHPTEKQCNYAYVHPTSKQCTGGDCSTISGHSYTDLIEASQSESRTIFSKTISINLSTTNDNYVALNVPDVSKIVCTKPCICLNLTGNLSITGSWSIGWATEYYRVFTSSTNTVIHKISLLHYGSDEIIMYKSVESKVVLRSGAPFTITIHKNGSVGTISGTLTFNFYY